jgi:hypothetical protein
MRYLSRTFGEACNNIAWEVISPTTGPDWMKITPVAGSLLHKNTPLRPNEPATSHITARRASNDSSAEGIISQYYHPYHDT